MNNAEIPNFQGEMLSGQVMSNVRKNRPFDSVTTPIDSFTRSYSRLPFSGKILLTPIARDSFSEADSRVKKVKAVKGAAVMGTFSLLHMVQAGSGANMLEQVDLQRINDPWVDFQIAVAGTYLLANTGAVVTQSRLATRMLG